MTATPSRPPPSYTRRIPPSLRSRLRVHVDKVRIGVAGHPSLNTAVTWPDEFERGVVVLADGAADDDARAAGAAPHTWWLAGRAGRARNPARCWCRARPAGLRRCRAA